VKTQPQYEEIAAWLINHLAAISIGVIAVQARAAKQHRPMQKKAKKQGSSLGARNKNAYSKN
jgi:hypothetical protein